MRKINNILKVIKLLKEAEKAIGSPYKYGAYAESPKLKESEFDCSSLIQYLYRSVNIKLPRSSIFQATKGEEIKGSQFLPGDLLFFRSDRGHYYDDLFSGKKIYIGHVAIYIADDLIIHAKSNKGVIKQKLSDLQKDPLYKVVLAKRILDLSLNIGGWKIPSFSQFLDITDNKYKKVSCGIVSLSMVMSFFLKKKIDPNEVLNKGIELDIKDKNNNWTHKGLVSLAKLYGLFGKAYDFAEKSDEEAIRKMLNLLKKHPILVSIFKDFNPKKSGHIIVLTGFKNGRFQYYDPNSKDRKEVKREIDIYYFIEGWKKRFILIKNKN